MLTPQFRCWEEGNFIVVEILLATHCKVADAHFDIAESRFTFFCRPYYLRLTFSGKLTEGAGEKATYDLSTNVLRVTLPKLDPSEAFADLDNPAVLLATAKQRVEMLSSSDAAPREDGEDDDDANDEMDEEFRQSIPADIEAVREDAVYYGFNGEFTGMFCPPRMDPDVVKEAIALPDPEKMSEEQRQALREETENAAFSEDQFFFNMEDADGEVVPILNFKPDYVERFERALREEGIRFVAPAKREEPVQERRFRSPADIGRAYQLQPEVEEDEAPLTEGDKGVAKASKVTAWTGNIDAISEADALSGPSAEAPTSDAPKEVVETAKDILAAVEDVPEERLAPARNAGGAPNAGGRRALACPARKPYITFTFEENDLLARVLPKAYVVTAPWRHVDNLLVDLLLTYAYDIRTTEGTGSSESIWTITKMSPALSWLCNFEYLDQVVVAFIRRVLAFGFHAHFGIAMRCVADVGVLLMLGPRQVIRALLSLKHVLDHSESKHVLAAIYLNPLLAHLTHLCRDPSSRQQLESQLERLASELHNVVTGAYVRKSGSGRVAAPSWTRIVDASPEGEPIPAPCPANLDLPFSADLME